MSLQFLLVALAVIINGVLPSANRPRTERLSRGPAWTDLRSLAIDQPAIVEAKLLRAELKRVAVVGDPDDPKTQVIAELIRSGLCYGDQLVVLDLASTASLFAMVSDDASIRECAKANNVDFVLSVQMLPDSSAATVKLVAVAETPSPQIDSLKIPASDNAIIAGAVASRGQILQALDAMPSQNASELNKQPQATVSGLISYVVAKRKVSTVLVTDNEAARKEICRDAIETLKQVLSTSPNFIEAYLLKASCEDELDLPLELKQTLTIAFQKSEPERTDRLTLLELKGDYARFVQQDVTGALEAYMEMVEVSPTYLTGLWGLIDILLTGDGTSVPDEMTLTETAGFAAMLMEFHPQSSVAIVIAKQKE